MDTSLNQNLTKTTLQKSFTLFLPIANTCGGNTPKDFP